MLRVTALSDRSGRYYLDGRSPGVWAGLGASALGLAGRADAATLGAVLSGLDPRSGHPLGTRPTTVSAFDLTFAAPKSVSVLYALADPVTADRVLSAQRAAVEGAIAYVSAHAAAVRRGSGADRGVGSVRGAVVASFAHVTSRVADPHVHTHVLVANLAQGEDGRWSAVDGRGLYAHARAAGALYDAHLRHGLRELGATWVPRANGAYELAGVDPVLMGGFSGRQAQIRQHLFEWSAATRTDASPSGRARSVAWAATRDEKSELISREVLREAWLARAEAVVGHEPVATVLGIAGLENESAPGEIRGAGAPRNRIGLRAHVVDEHRFAAALYDSSRAGAARRDVVAAWAGAVAQGSLVAVSEACVASLAAWGDGVGVAEERLPVSTVSVRPHHLAAIGPRPADPAGLETWRAAAAALDRYDGRWSLGDPHLSGSRAESSAALSTMPARQLAEHLSVRRTIEDARRKLGRDSSSVDRAARLVVEPMAFGPA